MSGAFVCPLATGVKLDGNNMFYCRFTYPADAKTYCASDPLCVGYSVNSDSGSVQATRTPPESSVVTNPTSRITYYKKTVIHNSAPVDINNGVFTISDDVGTAPVKSIAVKNIFFLLSL
jgi:hypothetical protein